MTTQKQIADRLGISRTTVARAINGSKNIKEETKKKILQLAKEMNYQKNYVGSSLASKRKKIFVFIVKSKNLFYTEQIKKGIKKIEEEYKYYNFEIERIFTDIENPEEQVRKLEEVLSKNEKIDGILITPLDKIKVYSILKLYLDKIKIVSMSIDLSNDTVYVGPNYLKEGKIAASILGKILREKEKILVVDNGNDNISSGDYLEGFLSNIKQENLKILGPFKRNGIEDSISFLNKILKEQQVDSIYMNRYVQDILKKIPKDRLKNKKIIVNGMGNGIRKLIEKGVIIASVVDDTYETSYRAGKIMFEMLYNDKQKQMKKNITEAKIVFLENLK